MALNTFSWKTAAGTNLYGQEWKPEKKVKAVIVLVHGLGEHCNRYPHVAEFFNQQNIAVLSFDQMGHGKSDGPRGHELSFSATCDDIQHLLDTAKKEYPKLPVFLYGHSLGASLVIYMALTRKLDISGVIATGPAMRPAIPVTPIKLSMAKLFNNLLPTFSLDNGLFLPGLSRDEKVVEDYKNDPFVTRKVSARLGYEILSKGPWNLEHAAEFNLPLLLLQGTEDKLSDPSATAEFSTKVPKQFITYREWNGFYHELHNEPEKQEVLEYELAWINKRISN